MTKMELASSRKFNRAAGVVVLAFAIATNGCSSKLPDPGGGNAAVVSVSIRRDSSADKGDSSGGGQAEVVAGQSGSLKGTIRLLGSAIDVKALVEKGTSKVDNTVCAKDAPILDEKLVVGPERGIANVFVYLDAAPKGGRPLGANESKADQGACIFKPHAVVVGIGSFELRNSDTVAHNVQTNPSRNSSVNVNLDPGKSYVANFKKAEKEPFASKCAIHPWMSFYTLVLDHPYGVVTSLDGSFEIKDVPAGKHKVRIWHEAGGKVIENISVEVKPGLATDIVKEYSREQLGVSG